MRVCHSRRPPPPGWPLRQLNAAETMSAASGQMVNAAAAS